MVTDYSGGYFDFMLSGKPILFAPFDLDKYKQQERDLYYPYEDVTLKPYAYTWPELIDNIVSVKEAGLPNDYYEGYKNLQQHFHEPLAANIQHFSDNLYQKLSHL